jgi:O-methyltransferase
LPNAASNFNEMKTDSSHSRTFEALTLKVFYSPLMRLFNNRVFLQFRPTFCRADNPSVKGDRALYDMLRADWKINDRGDLIRYYSLHLQLGRIDEQKIPGDIAELGVYQGNTAVFINRVTPTRTLHLFDTFAGFSDRDSKVYADHKAFKDVALDAVKRRFPTGVKMYVGYFPDTANQIPPGTKFALVHIDMDLEAPISAALEFFYPIVSPGGVIIVHDYNNTVAWDRGAKRAVDRFLMDKPETPIEMPDRFGSVVIPKVRKIPHPDSKPSGV